MKVYIQSHFRVILFRLFNTTQHTHTMPIVTADARHRYLFGHKHQVYVVLRCESSLSSSKQGRIVFSTTCAKRVTHKCFQCFNSISVLYFENYAPLRKDYQMKRSLLLTDWSTIGIIDCNTLATLNLMFGTLQEEILSPTVQTKSNKKRSLT